MDIGAKSIVRNSAYLANIAMVVNRESHLLVSRGVYFTVPISYRLEGNAQIIPYEPRSGTSVMPAIEFGGVPLVGAPPNLLCASDGSRTCNAGELVLSDPPKAGSRSEPRRPRQKFGRAYLVLPKFCEVDDGRTRNRLRPTEGGRGSSLPASGGPRRPREKPGGEIPSGFFAVNK